MKPIKFEANFQEIDVAIMQEQVDALNLFLAMPENQQYYAKTRGFRRFTGADCVMTPHWFFEDRVDKVPEFITDYWRWACFEETPESLQYLSKLKTLVTPITDKVRDAVSKYRGIDYYTYNAEIGMMHPGQRMAEHVDLQVNADITQRVHVVLRTNKDAKIRVEDEVRHFPVLSCFLFHNGRLHDVANDGDTMRSHLVIDLMDRDRAMVSKHVKIIDQPI